MGILIYILINTLTFGYFGVRFIKYRKQNRLREQELNIKMQTYLVSFQNDRSAL
jgi:hypothetical protein